VHGEAAIVGAQGQVLEVDDDAVHFVATSAEPVRPRREQREAGDSARLVAPDAAREGQELVAAMSKRDPEHPEVREEHRFQPIGGQDDGGHRLLGRLLARLRPCHDASPTAPAPAACR
jgi:hypothetical protein